MTLNTAAQNSMVTRAALAAAIALAVISVPAHASAWNCIVESCPQQCDLPITYAIGDLPLDVDETEGISAIQRAFDDWNAPTCVDFEFQYLGRVADLTEPATISVGVRPWSEQFGGASTWAIAFTSWMQNSCLVPGNVLVPGNEPDIALNDDDWSWSTDGTADFTTTIDLYTAVLSRIGSQLGISSSGDLNSVVGTTATMVLDGIGSADQDAICWLYADGDVAPRNFTPGDVPDHCAQCQTTADCATDEVCVPLFGAIGRVCVQVCSNDEPCAGDGECLVVNGLADPLCLTVEDGMTLTCPRSEPGDDMGTSESPDVGASDSDMGTTDRPDMGDVPVDESDMGTPASDTNTGGGGGCSTTVATPFGPGLLLLLGFLARRRQRS